MRSPCPRLVLLLPLLLSLPEQQSRAQEAPATLAGWPRGEAGAAATPSKRVELPLLLSSPAFEHQRAIPSRYTCDGEDISPPLTWRNVPERTATFALVMVGPDAPDPRSPKMPRVHWVAFNIPGIETRLAAGASLPPGARHGLNDWERTGYGGPCPAKARHRYFFRLYALDRRLDLERPTADELEAAMRPHVLAEALLVGTYQRASPRKPQPEVRPD